MANLINSYSLSSVIGIGTDTPNQNLTVVGGISGNALVYDQTGNSSQWNSVYTNVKANSGSYATTNYVASNYLNLTGGTITGSVAFTGNISAQGNAYFANTFFTTTSALCAVVNSSGPGLYITQKGSGDIASFYDTNAGEVLHIGGTLGIPGVGIYTSSPNPGVALTVNGSISSNNVVYASGGNSNQWNTAYVLGTAYQSNSGSFATNTLLKSTSALLTPLTLTNTLTSQLVLNTAINNLTGNWQSTYSYVYSTSATNNPTYNATTYSSCATQAYCKSGSNCIIPTFGGNTMSGTYGTIAGGCNNNVNTSEAYSFIGNGCNNINNCYYYNNNNTNGINNNVTDCFSTILNGQSNTTGTSYSTVVNGLINSATNSFSTVLNGNCNTASGYFSTINQGQANTITGASVIPQTLLHLDQTNTYYNFSPAGDNVTYSTANVTLTSVSKFGTGAVSFNGTSSYISIPNSYNITSQSAWSVDLWFYNNGSNSGFILGANLGSTQVFPRIAVINGTVGLKSTNAGAFLISSSFTANNWNHIALSYNNGTYYMFLNGVNIGNTTLSPINPSLIYIGRGSNTGTPNYYTGLIDEVRFFASATPYTTSNFTPQTIPYVYGSSILNGYNNNIVGDSSYILGGTNNSILSATNTYILGSNITTLSSNFTYVNNISSQGLVYDQAGNSTQWNTAYSLVSGGVSSGPLTFNSTLSSTTTLIGSNTASNTFSEVLGGQCNLASGTYSTIVNGFSSCATGYATFVGAGSGIRSTGDYSVVVGGKLNTASGCYSVIGGGLCNTINACFATVGGGTLNNVLGGGAGIYSTVGGGLCNNTCGFACSTIAGGTRNTTTGGCAVVTGGKLNTASGYSAVVGGASNVAGSTYAFVGGGTGNQACGSTSNGFSVIAGGRSNCTTGTCSGYSFIGSGCCNVICSNGDRGVLVGGGFNLVSGQYGVIVGGKNNTASGTYSFVAGGSANDTKGFANTFILGTGLSATKANFTYVNNLSVQGNIASNTAYTATAYLSATTTAPTNSDLWLPLTPRNDPNNWVSNTGTYPALSGVITPTIPGYYMVNYQIAWNGTTGTGQNNAQIRLNGTNTRSLVQMPLFTGSGGAQTQTATAIVYLNGVSDAINFSGYSSGTGQTITGTTDGNWTKVEVYKIN